MHVPMHVPAELLGQPIPQLVGFAVSQSGSPVETAHHAKRAPWGALVFLWLSTGSSARCAFVFQNVENLRLFGQPRMAVPSPVAPPPQSLGSVEACRQTPAPGRRCQHEQPHQPLVSCRSARAHWFAGVGTPGTAAYRPPPDPVSPVHRPAARPGCRLRHV